MTKYKKPNGKKNKTEWTWPFPIEEAWNVNHYIAKYALPRIQALIHSVYRLQSRGVKSDGLFIELLTFQEYRHVDG